MSRGVLGGAVVGLLSGIFTSSVLGYVVTSQATSTLSHFTRACPTVVGSNKIIETSYGFPMHSVKIKDGMCIDKQRTIMPLGVIINVVLFSVVGWLVYFLARRVI